MNEFELPNGQDENLKSAVVKYASYQPFIGLCSSTISALIQFLLKKQWSIELLFYVLIPFIGFCIAYAIVAIYMKSKHNTSIPFFNKKARLFSILAFVLFMVINGSTWYFNKPNEIQTISIDDLSFVSDNFSAEDKYFVVFTSQNCTYCHQMESVYTKAYAENPDIKLFICDLSFESTSNPTVTNRGITRLPLLACYQQETEVDRLEGVAPFETIVKFLKQ